MTIRFLIPGRCREKYLLAAYDEYVKRISRFAKVRIEYLTEENLSSKPSKTEIEKALDNEASRALRQLKEGDVLFLSDIHAPLVSTSELSTAIKEKSRKSGNLVFLLGSSYGLGDILRRRADFSFSLSNLTFTHYEALYLIIEQVYRCLKINSGETYDK
ncbi:MAG: 23S rRNA (pseudouridine(1915)-N(3))-methyltransferase RlmH [Bacilli bacterium]